MPDPTKLREAVAKLAGWTEKPDGDFRWVPPSGGPAHLWPSKFYETSIDAVLPVFMGWCKKHQLHWIVILNSIAEQFLKNNNRYPTVSEIATAMCEAMVGEKK